MHRIVRELLFQAGAKRGVRVVMDKSPDSVQNTGELMSLFDDLLFLNVVRDPRAQVSSMNKAIIHDFGAGRTLIREKCGTCLRQDIRIYRIILTCASSCLL